MRRLKKMPLVQFEEVREQEWRPLTLAGEAIPTWLRNIPEHILNTVMASGTLSQGIPYSSSTIPSGELIGGIDVYRNAPEDPVELNKDWYAIIVLPNDEGMLLVDGPFKDDEHWIDEIPERLQGAEVLAVPKRHSDTT